MTMIQRTPKPRDLMSDIIHELRTPLVPIVGYSEMLLHERLGELSQKQKDSLGVILRNCHRMQDLVDELLDWVRYREGRLVVRKESTLFQPLMDEVLLDLKPQADERSIRMEVLIPAETRVRADRDAIRRVLSGLLHQAMKTTARGGKVALSIGESSDRVPIDLRYSGLSPSDDFHWSLAEPILAAHGTSLRVRELPDGETEVSFDLESDSRT